MDPLNPERRRVFWLAAVIAAVTLLVFQRVFHQDYVNWDDGIHTYNNRHLVPRIDLGAFWRRSYEGLYIPVSYMVYALVAAIATRFPHFTTLIGGATRMNPNVFHAACLLLHGANTLLVFALLRRLTAPQVTEDNAARRDWACAAGALLFALHPVQTEAVAWISELRGQVCTVFSFAALALYLRRTRRGLAGAALCFAAALLSKPSAVSLPLVAFCLDWGMARQEGRRASHAAWFGLAGSAVLLLITRSAQSIPSEVLTPLWKRPFIAGDALAFYLKKLLWPLPAGPDYGRSPGFALAHGGYWTWLIPAAVFALAWGLRRRSPVPLAAMGVFTAALLPVLGLVPFAFQLYSTVADRYLYPAMLAPAWVLAWGLASIRAEGAIHRAALAVGILLTACGVGTNLALFNWDNALNFTSFAIATNPNSWIMHYNRGTLLNTLKRPDLAVPEFQRSIAIYLNYPPSYYNLAIALTQVGRLADAEQAARGAARQDPEWSMPSNLLAEILYAEGRRDAAIAQWQETVRRWPVYGDARYRLGTTLLQAGRRDEGIAQLKELVRRYPQFTDGQKALKDALQQGATHEHARP